MVQFGITKAICAVLGVFEFFSAATFFIAGEQKVLTSEKLLPALIATQYPVKVVFCCYLLTLGCQRLTYALSGGSIYSWLVLIITHVTEASLWWAFALLPAFRRGMSIPDLILEVAKLESPGGVHAFITLIGVPALVLFFLCAGPDRAGRGKTKRN